MARNWRMDLGFMMKFFKFTLLVFFLMLPFKSNAQEIGQLQAGQVWGNASASQAIATGTLIGPLLDQGYGCNAQGDIITRGASAWACLAPGTSGLPLVSQGAGASLHYATLANAALQNPSTTVNGQTCTLGSTCTISASAGTITVGTTTVAGGTTLYVLYDNAGVLGAYPVTGSGNVVLSASPTFSGIPVLAAPTATSLALGGATIGSDALGVTGSSTFNGNVKLNGISLIGTYTVGGTPSIAGSAINSGTVSGTYLSNINLAASGNGGVTGVLPIANGGTGGATVPPARVNLNIDEATPTGDANYVILSTDRMVYHTALSAARTDTLPAANSVNAGQILYLTDFAGVASASHTITLQRAGSDTINGVTSVVAVNAQYGAGIFWSDGTSKWTFFPASTGGGSGTVTDVIIAAGNGTAVTGTCNITVSGTCTITGAVPPPQGRLTLAANTPVMIPTSCSGSPCTNQTTLRYDCYLGSGVPYYNGTNDLIETISSCEVTDAMVSAASAGQVVASQVYDVWWVHGGANRICIAMSSSSGGGGGWASDTGGSNTARGTGYSQLDRTTRPYITNKNSIANCFNGSTNYGSVSANQGTYLGTVYANANGQISYTFGASALGGSPAVFGVWNMYNRRPVSTMVQDSTTTWPAVAPVIRSANNSTGMRISFVMGLQEDEVTASYEVLAGSATTSNTMSAGIGVNSISAFSGRVGNTSLTSPANGMAQGEYTGTFLGFNYLQAMEGSAASGTGTFFSTVAAFTQNGLHGRLFM